MCACIAKFCCAENKTQSVEAMALMQFKRLKKERKLRDAFSQDASLLPIDEPQASQRALCRMT